MALANGLRYPQNKFMIALVSSRNTAREHMHYKKGENDEPTRKADSLLCQASPFSGTEAYARTPADSLGRCTDRFVQQDERHSHPGL